jgi:hypothetical protein
VIPEPSASTSFPIRTILLSVAAIAAYSLVAGSLVGRPRCRGVPRPADPTGDRSKTTGLTMAPQSRGQRVAEGRVTD